MPGKTASAFPGVALHRTRQVKLESVIRKHNVWFPRAISLEQKKQSNCEAIHPKAIASQKLAKTCSFPDQALKFGLESRFMGDFHLL